MRMAPCQSVQSLLSFPWKVLSPPPTPLSYISLPHLPGAPDPRGWRRPPLTTRGFLPASALRTDEVEKGAPDGKRRQRMNDRPPGVRWREYLAQLLWDRQSRRCPWHCKHVWHVFFPLFFAHSHPLLPSNRIISMTMCTHLLSFVRFWSCCK